ncbi:MAG: efflux RND transporter permease subunit, partial [Acidimicrobiia bacterium]|nr:efflux RND transporter permease subunit [Acidimicrobiia bacterium]
VIQRVRTRLSDLERGLPPGVGIEVGYDRSDLITRSVRTLTNTMIQEIIVVTLICIVFLLHVRSAFVAVFVLPTGVLLTLTIMNLFGINANIMSLGGIAISIGVMVDSSIVMVENAHKHIEHQKERVAAGFESVPRVQLIATAAREVGPSLFFALLIITVSFIPVLALGEQAGRLFKPLAYTYIFAMGSSAILAVTIIPVLMTMFVSEQVIPSTLSYWTRLTLYISIIVVPALVLSVWPPAPLAASRWWLAGGWLVLSAVIVLPQRIMREDRLPAGRLLLWVFRPIFTLSMRFWPLTLTAALVLALSAAVPFQRLGSEFMPPLEEGDLLYMPSADPGISMTKARELLQQTDKLVRSFPEVQSVMGKIGRAETATDPAPPPMFETVVTLKRDKADWRQVARSFQNWPIGTRWLARMLKGDTRPITVNELVYGYEEPRADGSATTVPGLDQTLRIPGLTNAWTMPIKTRIDMLSTGIKTPVGVKVMGPDLPTLASLSSRIASVLTNDDATAHYTASAFPEKSVGGNYFDIRIDRKEIARYGLSVVDVQDVIMTAMGGMNVSSTVEGLERYPINVRYPHELRDNLPALQRTLVATPSGAQLPLGQLAAFVVHKGAPQIKSENARLTSWVFVDIKDIDVGTYVAKAQRVVAEQVDLPAGYTVIWSGQFEYMQAARKRLLIVAPITAVLIVLLLYMSTRSWIRVAMVLLTVPLSLIGAFWLLWALEYNMSVAVWVGIIALAGLDAEMGLVLLLYLDLSHKRQASEGCMRDANDLWHAVYRGTLERVRPITMTTMTSFIALTPLLVATGAGADTMRRLAVPVIGGLATGYVGVLLVLPIVYYLIKRTAMLRDSYRAAQRPSLSAEAT